MKHSSQEIDREAVEWALKRDSGRIAPEEEKIFEAWLDADVRHLGAYGRAEAVLARLDRLRSVGIGALHCHTPKLVWSRRKVMLTAGGAVGLAAAGIAGVVLWHDGIGQNYATALGEIRTVALSDGSIITLNTASRVSVRYSATMRKVDLIQGEALFSVAKNKKRPFVVSAGNAVVRAVGTSFTVRHLSADPVKILVQEGVVEVRRRNTPDASPVRAEADTQTIVPHRASISTRTIPYSQVARNLAWQYGQIAFDNTTLAEAASEFARYSDKRIVVEPDIASRTVTGLFASDDPVGFAKAVARALDLRLEVANKEVRIIR